MSVPVVVIVGAAGVDLDETHAALHQPPGQQTLAAEVRRARVVDTVQCQRVPGLPGEVHRLGSVLLHLEGQLVASDAGGQLAVVAAGRQVFLVLLAQPVEQVSLGGACRAWRQGAGRGWAFRRRGD